MITNIDAIFSRTIGDPFVVRSVILTGENEEDKDHSRIVVDNGQKHAIIIISIYSKKTCYQSKRYIEGGLMCNCDEEKGKYNQPGKPSVKGEGQVVDSTKHSGTAYIKNGWGTILTTLTLRHRRSNDPDKQEEKTWYSVTPQQECTMSFTYETGAASPFDYWWVSFVTVAGQTWTCKGNFYCSVASEDEAWAKLVIDGGSEEMTVSFSKSSGCYVGLSKS
jgi:hypothetical protein